MRPLYCIAPPEETGLPCACGATISGNDKVGGVCQAKYNKPRPKPLITLVLIDKETGEIV